MKYAAVAILGLICAFLLADFLFGQSAAPIRNGNVALAEGIPFDHSLHGDSIGLDCSKCHTGARSAARAYMPSKSDCMDCHRLPLTENPGIEKLDEALAKASEEPWSHKSVLPEHVVFHHGVHAAAGVECGDCHGTRGKGVGPSADAMSPGAVTPGAQGNVYGGEKFTMQMCLACHRNETFKDRNFKPAATYCGACHR